jgi:hypothetical protein
MSKINNELINSNIKKIAEKLGYKSTRFIGSGLKGVAYEVEGDKVLKITTDYNEAYNANILRTKPVTKHIINYYDVRFLKGFGYYSIVMDKVNPIDKKYSETYTCTYRTFLNKGLTNSEALMDISNYLDNYVYENDDEFLKFYVEVLQPQRLSILKEFSKYQIPSIEAHEGNVGFDDNNNFMFFDIGVGRIKGGVGKELKSFEMNENLDYKKHIPVKRFCKKCNKKTNQKYKETEKLHIYTCKECNNVEWVRKSKQDMKTIKLKESDLTNIVKRVLNEEPRVMTTVEPYERNTGPRARLGKNPINVVTPDKYESRKEMIQNVIDRVMKYGKTYIKELNRLNDKYPIGGDTFGRYSYDDIDAEEV